MAAPVRVPLLVALTFIVRVRSRQVTDRVARAGWQAIVSVGTPPARVTATLMGLLWRSAVRLAIWCWIVGSDHRRAVKITFGFLAVMTVGAMNPADAAGTNHINPTSVGAILVSPNLRGGNSPTLYEALDPSVFTNVDSDLGGVGDIVPMVFTTLTDAAMIVLVLFMRGAIVLAQWIVSQHVFHDLVGVAATGVHDLAATVFWPLLPVSLGAGAFAAYASHRRDRNGVNEFAWVIATAVVAIAFVTSPGPALNGLDNIRGEMAAATTAGLSHAVTSTVQGPVNLPTAATFNGPTATEATRKMSDAIWRTYVATPWCLEEFGSLEMCSHYGAYVLGVTDGGDQDSYYGSSKDRMDKIRTNADDTSSATSHWMVGKNIGGRLMIAGVSLVVAIPFAVLLIYLAVLALTSVIYTLGLAVINVLTLLCWPVRGRLRKVGNAGIEHLLGGVLQAFFATTILALTLLFNAGILSKAGEYGFFLIGLINIAATIAAFRYRKLLDTIFQIATPGHASPMAAFGAMQLLRMGGQRLSNAGMPGMKRPPMPKPSMPNVSWGDRTKRATRPTTFRPLPPALEGGGMNMRPLPQGPSPAPRSDAALAPGDLARDRQNTTVARTAELGAASFSRALPAGQSGAPRRAPEPMAVPASPRPVTVRREPIALPAGRSTAPATAGPSGTAEGSSSEPTARSTSGTTSPAAATPQPSTSGTSTITVDPGRPRTSGLRRIPTTAGQPAGPTTIPAYARPNRYEDPQVPSGPPSNRPASRPTTRPRMVRPLPPVIDLRPSGPVRQEVIRRG